MIPAVFLDRDGVICENRCDHVKSWQEFVFLPGALSALAALAQSALKVVVVTNQAIVNRGLVPAETVEEINRRMVTSARSAGGRIDRVYYCPHRPEDNCACRKPKPGLLLQAARELQIDLTGSYLVGDGQCDIEAAYAVGCTPILVLTGRGKESLSLIQSTCGSNRLHIATDLHEAVTHILTVNGQQLPTLPQVR